ncbi:GIY-YIG nuclease family protein [Priestia endophytica]|uniref:hypothetical protein n=1 Tax=Priestia endophytica TaxID=135735 RepID=UPI00124D1072|nr:hypothetical protein [Priestia endophytica]KAB2489974.1 hypothetical protein F8155_21520 [Priestia endophytica]
MYYIYQWFNIETNEIFYIGLGTGDRRFHTKQRNKLFKKYYQENNCAVRLLKTGLSEDEARKLEIKLIEELNPCCNMTKGGERTNGERISKSLKGKKHTVEHKNNVSRAISEWHQEKIRNSKEVMVLDQNLNIIKIFEAKYQVGIWLHNEFGYGKHARSAQRMVDQYFKSKEMFDNKFYFMEKQY